MSIGKIILTTLGALAILGVGVLLYGYVYEGWRLDSSTLTGDLFSSHAPEVDDRVAARHWEVELPDSSVIVIGTDQIDLVVRGAAAPGLTLVDAELEGDASDSSRYRVELRRTGERALRLDAGPVGPFTPPAHRSRLVVTAGGAMKVIVRTSTGEVVLEDLRGDLAVSVEKGNIEVEGTTGALTLKTMDGRIAAQRCRGRLDAEAAGQIDLNYIDGSATVAATERVTARNHTGSLEITSAGGGIAATLIGLGSACRMTSLAGDIRMETLPGIRATFDVKAPSGRIYNSLPFDTLAQASADGTMLRARINGGGVPVSIMARRGDVTLDEFAPKPSLD